MIVNSVFFRIRRALFAAVCLLCACAELPPEPPARVASAIVGDPADTDVYCDAYRFEPGLCDMIIEYEDHGGAFELFDPARVVQWGVGELPGEIPPPIYERGWLPSVHGGGTDHTFRVWLYDFVQTWERLCASATGTCGFHAEYKSRVNPAVRVILFYGRLGSGPRRFQVIRYYGAMGESYLPVRVYAVAYDFRSGHYGITPKAHLLEDVGGLANATAPPEYTTVSTVERPLNMHSRPFATPNPVWVFSTMIAPSIRFNSDWVPYE